jgi:hypothetical protein
MARNGTEKEPAAKSESTQAKKKSTPVNLKAPAAKATVVKEAPAKPEKKQAKSKAIATPAVEHTEKTKKPKLVRDSFTMPEAEYKLLGEVKRDCLKAGIEVKKSELLRVGVALLRQMEVAKLKTVLSALPPLKAGRPKKEK